MDKYPSPKFLKRSLAFCVWLAICAIGCEGKSLAPQSKSETAPVPKAVVAMEKVEGETPLSPEVKIKLKRDGKDNYSWEISGSDVNQILKVDEKLKKRLGGAQPR